MVSAGSAALALPVVDGLRRFGREWASSRACGLALAAVLRDGTAADVVAARSALRRYRVIKAAGAAMARHAKHTPPRATLAKRRLSGRELFAALLSWSERFDAAVRDGDVLRVPMHELLRFIAQIGDEPARVVRVLRAANLILPTVAGPDGTIATIRIPKGALDAA